MKSRFVIAIKGLNTRKEKQKVNHKICFINTLINLLVFIRTYFFFLIKNLKCVSYSSKHAQYTAKK